MFADSMCLHRFMPHLYFWTCHMCSKLPIFEDISSFCVGTDTPVLDNVCSLFISWVGVHGSSPVLDYRRMLHERPYNWSRFLPPATKLGQGNIFRSVCQEFCPRGGGEVVSQHALQVSRPMHGREGVRGGGQGGLQEGSAWQGGYPSMHWDRHLPPPPADLLQRASILHGMHSCYY